MRARVVRGNRGLLGTAARMVVVLLGALLLATATWVGAHENDGSNPSLIHACVSDKNGAVRIVGPTGSCGNKETGSHWLASPAGGSGPFLDLGFVVVDTGTGLMWEKKLEGSVDPHGVGQTMTWCEATGNHDAGTPCEGNTASWIGRLNAGAFVGFTDWRVPSRAELQSILECPGAPCIDPIFGPTLGIPAYWMSTEFDQASSLSLFFQNGQLAPASKVSTNLVRAVRGGP